MLTQKQVNRMYSKMKRFENTLEPMIFTKVGETPARVYETPERLYEIPDDSLFAPVEKGHIWGGEEHFCWFKSEFTVPENLAGRDLFIMPHTQGYETLLWVNGKPFGTFATKIVFTGHGNHYCDLLRQNAQAGEKIDIALEVYSGHSYKGCSPLSQEPLLDYKFLYNGIDICVKDYYIQEFYFDLKTVNELFECLPDDSFRKGEIANAYYEMHKVLYYSFEDTDSDTFLSALKAAHPFLKEILAVKNGPEAPIAGVMGHSHMDTAWLWKSTETIKKCARTYSNQISLMEQYPEYTFVQSSACHGNMILKHYPALFEDIKQKVKEGRYEPNGGVWVECDCNITSGESMVRQFLWGQRFTRKHFGYTSNTFWLPDTFGYSAAIPQIMKGCGVDYFCTTKLDWNDTNVFPYDTFYWQGLDGTKVFTHFNRTHCWPAPKALTELVAKDRYPGSSIKEKSVTNKRLIVYGYGDGGGGPQFEMIEMGRRCRDLNGCPKAEPTTVGKFMQELERDAKNPSTYKGELYLELHRGTLTNQHSIKHNNRKSELALRDLEFLTVNNAVKAGVTADNKDISPLWETLLLNQFHDILPGTCIPSAHKLSLEQTGKLLETASALIKGLTVGEGEEITLTNTLSFDRCDPVFLECEEGLVADLNCKQQRYTNLDGKSVLILSGIVIPAFSTVRFRLIKGEPESTSAFSFSGNKLSAPNAEIVFDEKKYISSLFDKNTGREIRGEGYPLGTLITAEDLPSDWDNWDVDADLELKFRDNSELTESEVVSQGSVAFIIRNTYKVTAKSTVKQDVIVFADSSEIRYDTLMNWQDDHRFMKVAFDTSICSDFARSEIQYGNVLRPTTRNNSLEKAKFEVVNHKYTDLSETRNGVAVLNDSKYAIGVEGGKMRLSLHKGGNRPDFTGDHGLHRTVYSLLPHKDAFNAENVIRPAYELNIPAVAGKGDFDSVALIVPAQSNIIVESIKPCEDCEKAFIARLYEAEGSRTHCNLDIFSGAKKVEITNMLEEVTGEYDGCGLVFRPFEIKTLKISY
ncbi:MAG: alpha-mannosidase [Clostridia bacterium]|nr:alpha-mannosidase [Clostridia bacterium]